MSQVNTYSSTKFVTLRHEYLPVETAMETGIYEEYGTTTLTSWHPYKSFAWFDSTQMSSDMHNRRVTRVSLTFTTEDHETGKYSPGKVNIPFYKTDIAYDSSKTGNISADTLNPASGMTGADPFNEHFIARYYTQSISKAETLTDVTLCEGHDAADLVDALCNGYAIGSFNMLNSTSVGAGNWNCRAIYSLSITIYSEPLSDITPPTYVGVVDRETTDNGPVRIRLSGAEQVEGNPILGYKVKKRFKMRETQEWSDWSAPETVSAPGMTDGIISVTVSIAGSIWSFAICGTSEGNDTVYVEASGDTTVAQKRINRICVFDRSASDYTTNGVAILTPTECTVKEKAGGEYELTMTHPLDSTRRWENLQTGNIVKARVPAAPVESVQAGKEIEVWSLKSGVSGAVFAKAIGKLPVRYSSWGSNTDYNKGNKVTLNGNALPPNNWQCIKDYPMVTTEEWRITHRPLGSGNYTEYWKKIESYEYGSSVVTTLSAGQEVYKVDEQGTWTKVHLFNGIEGYIETSNIQFVRTEQTPAAAARGAVEQLFRIYDVKVDTAKKNVSVSARHVSYDLTGNLLKDCKVNNQSPDVAISMIRNAAIEPLINIIATNLDDDDGTITQDYSWKNVTKCLLDPETGIVGICNARLVRDNWDLFIYKKKDTDRGVQLRYGKNLRGVTWTRNVGNLVTRVVPFAHKANGDELLLDDVYVDSPIIDSYPVIYTERLSVDGKVGQDDGSGNTWTTETLLAEMQKKAEARFSVDHADSENVSVAVDFILLGDTAEYAKYKDLQKIYMYDTVHVIDENVGLDQELQVSEYEWDCIKQKYNKITLGETYDYRRNAVQSYNISNGGIPFEKLSPAAVEKIRNG